MAVVARYIVERGPEQVRNAFRGILDLCANQGINRVTLVVPRKGGWEHTIVAEALGQAIAKALQKGQRVKVTDDVTMTLESSQTFRASVDQGLLVGAHISIKDMNKLDDAWGAQAIMYLPWTDKEGQEWHATWHPETVGPKTQNAPPSSLLKPVEEALRELTESINLGTGLGHPSDKKHAERAFDRLRSEGHSFDPAEVRRWAQRNGWSSNAAADLEAVARRRT
jgi:hypothetical protein